MRDFIDIAESLSPHLSDFAEVKTNFPDADFWIERRGSIETVGEPKRDFYAERIGICVTATDVLDPRFLYYRMQYAFQQGYWRQRARGTLKLVSIRVEDVKGMPIGG